MGVAAGFRNNMLTRSRRRASGSTRKGVVTVETDMTDIGTGTYTIIAQTAAEMMGVPLDKVVVLLGDFELPRRRRGRAGNGAANSSTAGVYAACMKLREAVAQKLGFNRPTSTFADGKVARPATQRRARRGGGRGRRCRPRTRSSTATSTRSISNRPSPAISSRSASTPIPARSASGGCWRCARRGASSTRSRRAAR